MGEAMKSHTRQTDEELLMQFAEEQGWGEADLMEAVDRLRNCHKEELQDYSFPVNDGE